LVVESPATSSPGLAFLLGTVAHFGQDGWQAYWTQLKDNGVKVTGGWTDAYTVDFSGSSGKGARPLVVSYASSPPAEVPAGATTAPTGALLDTCFRQVEYAGVLQDAKNPAGAQQVIDFLLSPEFQASVPEGMYVYPVDSAAPLPATWQQFAPVATAPAELDPAVIAANTSHIIDDLVAGFIASLPAEQVYHAAQERGFTWGAVRPAEALLHDPHLHDRGFWKQVEHPELGRNFTYPGEAALYTGSPWRISRRAPLIGEHNTEIFCGELGLSRGELSILAENRVV